MPKQRIAIFVDADVPEKLLELAGGQRKQGEFISQLVREAWTGRAMTQTSAQESLRLQLIGMMAELQEVKGRLSAVEGQQSGTDES